MFKNNFTKLVNGDVHFDLEFTDEPTDLIEYVNQYCKDKCNIKWSIDNPPECDCAYSRLYYAMVKLAVWEHQGGFDENSQDTIAKD